MSGPDPVESLHAAELGLMQASLRAAGYPTELLPVSDELPVTSLVVDLGDDDMDRRRFMTISIMPFGDDQFAATEFIQFYVPMPYTAPPGTLDELGHAMAVINAAMAVGHFAVRGSELFYRYMLALDSSATIGDAMLGELFALLVFHQEHFSDYLEGVLDGEISLLVLPELISSSDPE
jgi:hypothetical protein